MGPWSIALMCTASLACGLSSGGLFVGARWGLKLAVGLLTINAIGDALNAILSDNLETLIGLPVAGALIAYLFSRRVRGVFAETS
jgi:hypothetical protein